MTTPKPHDGHNSEVPTYAPVKTPRIHCINCPAQKYAGTDQKKPVRGVPLTGLSSATAPDYCAGGAAGLALALCFFGAGALRDCGCTWVSSTVVPSSSCPPHRLPSGTK